MGTLGYYSVFRLKASLALILVGHSHYLNHPMPFSDFSNITFQNWTNLFQKNQFVEKTSLKNFQHFICILTVLTFHTNFTSKIATFFQFWKKNCWKFISILRQTCYNLGDSMFQSQNGSNPVHSSNWQEKVNHWGQWDFGNTFWWVSWDHTSGKPF